MGSLVFAVVALIAMGAQAAPGPMRPSAHLDTAKIKATPPPTPFDDECCSDPGQITECWWQDATQDNVTCKVAADCPSGQGCNLDPENKNPITDEGLCECTTQAHCEAGIGDDKMAGVCTDDGVCGPSYCNGIKICSCFGGCKTATWTSSDGTTTYDTPQELCENTAGAGFCCEGEVYAATPGTSVQGYCWSSDLCGEGGPPVDAGVPECVARWDSCAYADSNECTAGMCVGPDGGPYDCQPVPLSSAAQIVLTQCCDPTPGFESTYDDGDPCTDDLCCSSAAACNLYHEYHPYVPDDSALEYWERFDCADQHPFADICQKWFCEDDGAGGLSCQEARAEGDDCTAWAGASCGSVWTCVTEVCTETTPGSSTVGVEEDCASTTRVDFDADDTTNGDNTCGDDDYDTIYTTGSRFQTCSDPTNLSGTSNADMVYHYDVTTGSGFGLEHVRVELKRDDSSERWSPYMHAREDEDSCTDESAQVACTIDNCVDGFASTGYPYSTGFDCSGYNNGGREFDKVMTVGPWPIRDTTDSTDADGIVSAYDWTGSIIIDHLEDTTPTDAVDQRGGEFELETEKEDHYNDDCRNTGAYLATPVINNFTSWKERWRGQVDDHGNFVATTCTAAADPVTAFYRIELEGGASGTSGNFDYWPHRYKIYTNAASTLATAPTPVTVIDTVLSRWNGSAGRDYQCQSDVAAGAEICDTVGGAPASLSSTQEFYFEDGEAGWLAVSNWDAADTTGNYELNVLRAPRPFFGFQEPFADSSIGCSGTTAEWYLAEYRLDFLPTNDPYDGYAVTTTSGSSGWLVDPSAHVERCSGLNCRDSGSLLYEFPFAFPYSGELFTHFCINTAGQVKLGDATTTCPYDSLANSEAATEPWVAPLWGQIIPCWCSVRNNTFWGDNAPWDGNECTTDGMGNVGKGTITTMEVDFEGTRAIVISWDGFDGNRYPSGTTPTTVSTTVDKTFCDDNYSDGWGGTLCDDRCFTGEANCIAPDGNCATWNGNVNTCQDNECCIRPVTSSTVVDGCVAGSSDGALQFQVILREDGRFVFHYKSSEAVTEGVLLNENAWVVGISGNYVSPICTGHADNDAWCMSHFNSAEAYDEYYCDDTNHGVTEFTPGYRCLKDLGQNCSGGGASGCSGDNDWHIHDGQDGAWVVP